MKVIVTGAGGFIGKRLIEINDDTEFKLIPLSLRNQSVFAVDLCGADAIIHLAGKAHDLSRADPQIYYDINYTLTKSLAEKAVQQNVSHFIYVSTIKVYGAETGSILNEHSPCHPVDAYGKSKLQAEIFLQNMQSKNFKVAIVRPPLVYGAGVKGNMLRLINLATKNTPLPFAKINNRRSMVYVDNLIELLHTILREKASGIFLTSDEAPLSTEELLIMIKKNLGKKNNFISLPKGVRKVLKFIKPNVYQRLFGSLVIDNSETNKLLNFKPKYSTDFGIKQMVEWFKATQINT